VRIIPEQNASKIFKISQQMAKLWRKLKWLVFFWDTVYSCKTDAVFSEVHDQWVSRERRVKLTRCLSAVAELLLKCCLTAINQSLLHISARHRQASKKTSLRW